MVNTMHDSDDETDDMNFKHLTSRSFGQPKSFQHNLLQDLIKPHIESYNYFIHEGLYASIDDLLPLHFQLPNDDRVTIKFSHPSLAPPCVSENNKHAKTLQVFPTECRQRGMSYKGALDIHVSCSVNGRVIEEREISLGQLPVMVKSDMCNLSKLTPAELVKRNEEEEELGGYFVINGNEKVVRMLILNRRNLPLSFKRERWKTRGGQFTEYGISCRMAKDDHEGQNMYMHYLSSGGAVLCVIHEKEMFFLPIVIILKGLIDCTDKYIYDELVKGREDNAFYKGCVVNMLQDALGEKLYTRVDVLKYIGNHFRAKLANRYCPPWYTDEQAGHMFFKVLVCFHLNTNREKFNFLVQMTKKLYAFAKGECAADSPDNPMNWELLLSGHLVQMVVKEKMNDLLLKMKLIIMKFAEGEEDFKLTPASFQKCITQCTGERCEVTRAVEYLLSTGNLTSRSKLGLMQNSGFAIVADRLNFNRFLSHFRCVHRGAFFATLRSTTVRKLQPEAWGFLCPVHTPDGAPCGLLNHLTYSCQLVTVQHNPAHLLTVLDKLGMCQFDVAPPGQVRSCYVVLLDGIPVGYVNEVRAKEFCDTLRLMKVKGIDKVPAVLEICLVPWTKHASQYPGIYLFLGPARMMRPVMNLTLGQVEMIGSFEQVYMDICITEEEMHPGVTTHQELSPTNILSTLANMTPFSDFNQSPRNMYQCQMAKQTLGTACHNLVHRADNKLYRILTPQAPLVRPHLYSELHMDNYPQGTNAVIAVISYTGYDMEDAMVINKMSAERGFAHGCVYMTRFISLQTETAVNTQYSCELRYIASKSKEKWNLEPDGLPPIGAYLEEGSALYSYVNIQTGEMTIERYKGQEAVYVDSVKIMCNPTENQGPSLLQRAVIVLRVERNPIIGDKFATRHGQKGICSLYWPAEDMPFTESGMTPDIIFNPHGFPSRMTIGMMIEIMAGKSAALHGLCHDSTPFTFSEDQPAIDFFGQMLTKAGYNYYGNETMYSGVDGRELEVGIFFGVVYYQRLRHMVSDKFQVRSTGPVDPLTHQPVKGRKKSGGIRFGEMERDALIAHGTAFLLHDRLFHCSDGTKAHICTKCGSILSPCLEKPPITTAAASYESRRVWRCLVCKTSDTIKVVAVPYVFRYLVAELAAMNIKLKLEVE